MHARSLVLCAALAVLLPLSARAQLDDFLTPLTPEESKKKKAPKRTAPPKKKPRAAPAEEFALEPLVARGELVVRVSGPADGAQVTVNGQEVRPGQKLELDSGEHAVVVRRLGWADFSRKVKLAPGQKLEVPAALDPVGGVLMVTADVPGSAVLVDGKLLGTTPLGGQVVPPGMREVVVRKDGYEDHVSKLSIRAGRDYTVASNLRPAESHRTIAAVDADRPAATRLVPDAATEPRVSLAVTPDGAAPPEWYQRWYVWAGVGAAAAVVTGAVIAANNSGGGGGPTSTEICGGACDAVMNGPAGAILRF